MERTVLINGGNLAAIKRLIKKTFETSDIKENKIKISNINKYGDNFSADIIVLNTINPITNLTKAIDKAANFGAIVLNSDEENFAGPGLKRPVKLITYGLNPKSTVTASSIDMEGPVSVQCCIQRSFENFSGDVLEPQEFLVSPGDVSLSVYDVLAAVSISLLCGACIKNFSREYAHQTAFG